MLETGQRIRGRGSKTAPLLIAAALACLFGGIAYMQWWAPPAQPPPEAVLTDEARAYLPRLDLSGVEMSATENALGHTLVEIVGRIANLGERPVRSIRLNCVFFDVHGIELHRVPSVIVRSRTGLPPGEDREFRLPFDDIPEGWNQVLPSLYISEIVFD